ncbi:unnamed protein product [Penicillium salamii]|uniref:DUF2415 domain-containing protein n=1 Tax=Penicillium salamii TaxID=1612424 RepID=A0A9W4J3H7_9EURO|nr:unnamed protein product [Penicillium salamii]CAG8376458.1 unnamed protein product [Penicillium salamii]CAG8378340.1 unnamed protein product [Penicillium salamii]CAG8412234.1 unnamed protein product [Penicillium salamii]
MTSDSTIDASSRSRSPTCPLIPLIYRAQPNLGLLYFSHVQLRNYISTADPDRIYVVVERIVYAIHISAQTRASIALIPFEPRCLAAGHGWIAVGGSDNGECAFIRIGDRGMQAHGEAPSFQTDVDSALPLDLDPPSRVTSPDSNGDFVPTRYRTGRLLPEVELHRFGGSIVNSVTIHRFYGGGEGLADEDVVVLSNNDRTVTVYSMTRAKVIKTLHHSTCMNYATISPDAKLLTAVGDENHAYFYEITRDLESVGTTESGDKLPGWEWELTNCLEMDIGLRAEDACCFAIAFSPSSRLCAIGSQSGVITVINVASVYQSSGEERVSPILCQFPASRSNAEGGAVRCMTFSPEPWDLLVWLEGHGRAGIADVRQHFLRRQIIQLDSHDSQMEKVYTDFATDGLERQRPEDRSSERAPHARSDEDPLARRNGEDTERSSLRESLIHDLSERERLIMEFLNTARWTTMPEEGTTERPGHPLRANVHTESGTRPRNHGSTDGATRTHRPTSPLHHYDLSDVSRDSHSGRAVSNPRRRSSVILSQGNLSGATSSHHDHPSSITLSYSTSPSEDLSLTSEIIARANAGIDAINNDNRHATDPNNTSLGINGANRRSQRAAELSRRVERLSAGAERGYDASRLETYEIRANVAAERLRRQRQIANEVHNRSFESEQRQRQQLLGFEQTHSPRWIRNIINDLPDRSSLHNTGAEEPDSTAGIGWGADGRTLYIATLEGIFEFQLNIHDRKTFPVFSCR